MYNFIFVNFANKHSKGRTENKLQLKRDFQYVSYRKCQPQLQGSISILENLGYWVNFKYFLSHPESKENTKLPNRTATK